MKIKVSEKSYDEVCNQPREKHVKPKKQSAVWRHLMKTLSAGELKATNFTYETVGMENLGKDEPALFLMNHSSFTDLQITSKLLADRQYHIVMTNDGFVGKAGLMRMIGCIPVRKFILDSTLIKDMLYAINTLKSSILMYPEASYSFDGTQTPLPASLGKCIKLLKVPVVMIRTKGAFLRDPLYNNLQKRKVNVSAKEILLLTKEDVEEKSVDEINDILANAFEYNHFKEQVEAGILIDEPFRADGLHRPLYKCISCGSEDSMHGEGTTITCKACGDTHELMADGRLKRTSEDKALHMEYVTDWYAWERKAVREEIENKTYSTELDVEIMMLVDTKSMYKVGKGHLSHTEKGWRLTGCDGKIDFTQSVKNSYSLYADYFWYEIGDMIAIGDTKAQYYCFPKNNYPVAKARLATEEMYKSQLYYGRKK